MAPTTLDAYYALFGVPDGCDDDALRRAFHRAMRAHHPDLHSDRLEEATIISQRLTSAYAELRRHREGGAAMGAAGAPASGSSVTFSVVFAGMVDRDDIARRKTAFRGRATVWREMGAGLRELVRTPALRALTVAVSVGTCGTAMQGVA